MFWSKTSKQSGIFPVLSTGTRQKLKESGVLAKMQLKAGGYRPVGIICETINICNSDCIFCPYSMQSRKKGVMSLELFRKILRDYAEMGGGAFSLTPMVGDILLDRQLPRRLEILSEFQKTIVPSVTTNLYALDQHSDETILRMLESFSRIWISTYGITEEECETITKRKHFRKYLTNARRFASLWEKSENKCEVRIGFRNLHVYPEEQLHDFVLRAYGQDIIHGGTTTYANWGNSMRGQLGGEAQWVASRQNNETCVLLVVAVQVYWDGRVSACACCDYDAGKELFLGDVSAQTLKEIYNSALNQHIWQEHETGKLPAICKECTFHVPLSVLHKDHPIANKLVDFIGG